MSLRRKLVWRCDVCGEERSDPEIDVAQHDFSKEFGFPALTVMRNVKYCWFRQRCRDAAHDRERWRFNLKRGSEVE